MSPYQQQQVSMYQYATHRVSKTRQVIMLYEGITRLLQQAKQAIADNNIQERYNTLSKACEIINGLQLSLDHEKGGEIAKLLYEYYAGMDMRLLSVHQSNDIKMIDATLRHIQMMREAWEEIDAKYANKTQDDASVLYNPAMSEILNKAVEETEMPPSYIPSEGASGFSVSI
jgi:flagellar secretion chaperone FliS